MEWHGIEARFQRFHVTSTLLVYGITLTALCQVMVNLPTGKFYRTTFDLFANKSINLSRTDYGHIILTAHTKHLGSYLGLSSLVDER